MAEKTDLIKVLLVEDNEYDAQIVADLFRGLPDNSFALRMADSLAKAGAADAAERADVVLLDLNLPDSYGPDTLVRAKLLFQDRAIIVMTGFYEEHLGVNLIQRGAQDYLVKGKLNRDWLSYSIKYSIERAKIEAQMRRRESRLRHILETIPDGFLVLRKDGSTAFVNRGMERLLGRTRAELLNRHFNIESDTDKALKTEIQGFGGKTIPVEIRAVEINWDNENCRLVMLRDMTTLQLLERTRDELVSRVSHELRSPLTVVKESIELVYDGTAGEATAKQKEILKMGLENVARLNRLIDAVMDITKIEAGVMPMDMAQTDLGQMLASTAADYTHQAAERKVQLSTELPASPILTWCDQDKLREVLINLVSNALKFTPPGGRLQLSLRPWEGEALFCVENSGPGIAPEDLPKLFGKFTQLGGGPIKGTGLGLAISRGLVEMHRGRIWAESEPGKGCKFLVLLPELSFEGALALLAGREITLAAGKHKFCALRLTLPQDLPVPSGEVSPGAAVESFLRASLRNCHAIIKNRGLDYVLFLPNSSMAEFAKVCARIDRGLCELFSLPPGEGINHLSGLFYPDDFTDEQGLAGKIGNMHGALHDQDTHNRR
ncbi:MAG: hybrid sensor histidine kinase/response regulator [Elusimicrobiales bacterium]|nr:hybrid sensor histidine kinase/response regulator [Elusimicrobiales bacterium]